MTERRDNLVKEIVKLHDELAALKTEVALLKALLEEIRFKLPYELGRWHAEILDKMDALIGKQK